MEKERRFPVVEIFGPTIQGEGPEVGTRCVFVRFGGCDYRCTWCDTKQAVLPEHVRDAERLTAQEIVDRVSALVANVPLVILSGGNPALLDLEDVVDLLQDSGYRVSIETQGSVWKGWLRLLDHIVVSPKPPSAGYGGNKTWTEVTSFLEQAPSRKTTIKVPCLDSVDVQFAGEVAATFPTFNLFLSVVTRSGGLDGTFTQWWGEHDTEQDLLERYEEIIELAHKDPRLRDARIIPQLHYLVWGTEKGR